MVGSVNRVNIFSERQLFVSSSQTSDIDLVLVIKLLRYETIAEKITHDISFEIKAQIKPV